MHPLLGVEKLVLAATGLLVFSGLMLVLFGAVTLYRQSKTPQEVKAPSLPPGCCLETRDGKFIRAVGSDCNQWRLAIPGCE